VEGRHPALTGSGSRQTRNTAIVPARSAACQLEVALEQGENALCQLEVMLDQLENDVCPQAVTLDQREKPHGYLSMMLDQREKQALSLEMMLDRLAETSRQESKTIYPTNKTISRETQLISSNAHEPRHEENGEFQ
jgi:hypothetical protein